MNNYVNTLTNTRGDSLPGYRVQALNSTGAVIDIFSDKSGTRFRDSAGAVVNYATASPNGKVEFYFAAARGQTLQVLDPAGSLVEATANFADNLTPEPTSVVLSETTTLADTVRVNMARFGFREAASAAQNLAAIEDAIGEYGGGSHPIVLEMPPGSYECDLIGISTANVGINGNGSTLIGCRIASSPAATNLRLKGLRLYNDTNQSLLTLNNDFGSYHDIELVKFGAGNGYMAMVEGVTGCVFNNWRFRGGNGMFVEGEKLLFNAPHGIGRSVGGDDFIVLKARAISGPRRTGDIIIAGAYAENYSNGLAAGSEIGKLGADDAARTGRVENVYAQMVLKNCTYGVYLKPGAIDVPGPSASAYDWRDGLVRNVHADLVVDDESGTKMSCPYLVTPARRGLVEDCSISVKGTGRFAVVSGAPARAWGAVFLPDSTAYAAPAPGGTARRLKVKIDGRDTWDGVSNGTGGAPGHAPIHGFRVECQNPGVGTASAIDVEIDVHGAAGSMVYVGAQLDDAVNIVRSKGRELCVDPPATYGGITALSRVRAAGVNDIGMANTTYKPILLIGSGDVIGRREMIDLNGAAGAGIQAAAYRQFDHAVWLRKGAAVSRTAVGSDGTNFLSLELRALSGNRTDGTAASATAFGGFSTSATAITAGTPFSLAAFATSGDAYNDRFLASGALIRAAHSGSGAGQPFSGTMFLDYVQIGAAA